MSQEIMKMGYYACFHSTISYGLIFWGNSIDYTKVLKMQRRQLEVYTGIEILAEIYKYLKIVPFHSQCILTLLLFVAENKSMHNLNSDINNINIRQKFNFHQHSAIFISKRSSLLQHCSVQ
jgi:hypothetical protein